MGVPVAASRGAAVGDLGGPGGPRGDLPPPSPPSASGISRVGRGGEVYLHDGASHPTEESVMGLMQRSFGTYPLAEVMSRRSMCNTIYNIATPFPPRTPFTSYQPLYGPPFSALGRRPRNLLFDPFEIIVIFEGNRGWMNSPEDITNTYLYDFCGPISQCN